MPPASATPRMTKALAHMPSAQPKPKTDAPPTTPGSPPASKLDSLKKNPAYFDGNHPDHAKVMREVRALMAAEEAETQPEYRAEMTVEDKRDEFGVSLRFNTGKAAEEDWDTAREADAYDVFHAWSFESSLVQDIVNDYVQAGEGVLYRRMPDATLDRLAEKYVKSGRVTKAQAAALKSWYASWAPPA